MAKEISGLALQYGVGDRGTPLKHRDGAERALKPPMREIPALALQNGGGKTRQGAGHRYPPMKTDASSIDLEHGEASTSHPSTPAPPKTPPPKGKPMANMVHMRRTPEERASANMPMISDETNHGMCFELCGPELDKLEMEGMPEPNDLLHFTCMARVVGIQHDASGPRVRLEVIGMGIENESTEDVGMDDDDRMKSRYGGEDDE
jgi:hypothetical protein